MANKKPYSEEEKQRILDNLNEKRVIDQKAKRGLDGKKANYSEDEKQKVLDKLNEQRLSVQKKEDIAYNRTGRKKIYHLAGKEYFQFKGMEREYFILLDEIEKVTLRQGIYNLFYKTFNGLKAKEVLIKTEIYSEQFFISYDIRRVYFKGYSLVDEY